MAPGEERHRDDARRIYETGQGEDAGGEHGANIGGRRRPAEGPETQPDQYVDSEIVAAAIRTRSCNPMPDTALHARRHRRHARLESEQQVDVG